MQLQDRFLHRCNIILKKKGGGGHREEIFRNFETTMMIYKNLLEDNWCTRTNTMRTYQALTASPTRHQTR